MRPALLAAALLLLAGCDALNPMASQQKVKPFRPSDFYADGVSMRPPPPGTVATGAAALPAEVVSGAGPDGKPLERIPVKVTPELLQLGRKKFEIHCAVCHGLVADGDSLVGKNMSQRLPPSLHQRVRLEDGHYFQVISRGFGVMPPYAAELTVDERWAVVAWVRALQLSQSARLDDVPPQERARLEAAPKEGTR